MRVKIETVLKDLDKLFDIDNNVDKGTYTTENRFAISKPHFHRGEVLNMLQIYFKDRTIINGYLKVGKITFLHTHFEVVKGKP